VDCSSSSALASVAVQSSTADHQTGEMVAIKMALEDVCQLEQTTTHRRYAILTDI